MQIAQMTIAALLFMLLLAVAIAQLVWATGSSWPIRDPAMLAQTVVGRTGVTRVPRGMALITGLVALVAGVVALAVADPTGGGAALTIAAAVLAMVFIARGVVGYTDGWKATHPLEPYAALNRRNYSPVALVVGIGLLILVVMRLV